MLVGGSYNGLLCFYDLRTNPNKVKNMTSVEKSHQDPVYDVFWLKSSKTGTECCSTSTDGRILWWDLRKHEEPTDSFMLTEAAATGIKQDIDNKNQGVFGGTCLEANPEQPTKYLVGTEQGVILSANKRPKKPVEINQR